MFEKTNVSCDNCIIKDFATAIGIRGSSFGSTTSATSSLILTNSIITNTTTGIECNEGSCITLKGSKIVNSTHYGVITTCGKIKKNKLLLSDVHEAKQHNIDNIVGDCKFTNCTPHNMVVFNRNDMCLLKNNVVNGDANGINCSSLEMDDCNQTNGNDTSSELDCSVIVVDD